MSLASEARRSSPPDSLPVRRAVVSRVFPPRRSAVRAARAFVLDAVGSCTDRDTIALLASEVATNAVIHAGTEFTVTVSVRRDRVRVEVADRNPTPVRPALVVDPDSESGRGLLLVTALARAWGSDPTAEGKVVWFETIAVPGAAPARPSGAAREPATPT